MFEVNYSPGEEIKSMKINNLISMSEDTKYVGINREDENSFRPGCVLEFANTGESVNIPVNDGFITSEADQPYFIARSCYSGQSMTISLSQINEALALSGLKIEFKDIPVVSPDNVKVMYDKSKNLGLCKFQPKPGGGLICSACRNQKSRGYCEIKDDIAIELFNDGIEYCYLTDNEDE